MGSHWHIVNVDVTLSDLHVRMIITFWYECTVGEKWAVGILVKARNYEDLRERWWRGRNEFKWDLGVEAVGLGKIWCMRCANEQGEV